MNAQSSGQTTPNPTQAPLDQLAAPKNSADITIPKIKFISHTHKDGHSSFKKKNGIAELQNLAFHVFQRFSIEMNLVALDLT